MRNPKILLGLLLVLLSLGTVLGQENDLEIEVDAFSIISNGSTRLREPVGERGEIIRYVLRIRNTGESILKFGRDITVWVPEGTAYIPNSALRKDGLALSFSLNGQDFHSREINNPIALNWTLLEDVPPNTSHTVRFDVQVNRPLRDGIPTPLQKPTDSDAATRRGPAARQAIRRGSHAFTQAMFGHLGVIEVVCPGEPDPTVTCGEVSKGFQDFRELWDLYADYEDEIPIVPTPLSSWRRDANGFYSREYVVGSAFYSVGYLPEGDRFGFVLIYSDE